MKAKILAVVLAVAAVTAVVSAASADTGYTATYSTSITYQNVGSVTATISINFYAQNNGTAINYSPAPLAAGASASIFSGNVGGLAPGFQGSAVLSSDQPIVATLVQISTGGGTVVKNRPLSNGFGQAATKMLIATTLKNKFNSTTKFSVQNADSVGVDLVVKFFDADNAGNLVDTINITNLPVGSAQYFDLGTIVALPNGFNGSATVDAVQTGTATPANVAATALELGLTSTDAKAFEGVSGGANTVYMPSAQCNFSGTSSAYAIQNTSTTVPATVTVSYKDTSGSPAGSANAVINPGAKHSFLGCTTLSSGFNGSATITSVGAAIVGIGKIAGGQIGTAFVGPASGGAKLALPYVRWSQTQFASGVRQRTNIAIQNIGGALSAGQVSVQFVDKYGVQVGNTITSPALNTGQKFSTNPLAAGPAANEFGYYVDNTFGGGAIITGPGGSQLVSVARVISTDTNTSQLVGEDYNGIPVN